MSRFKMLLAAATLPVELDDADQVLTVLTRLDDHVAIVIHDDEPAFAVRRFDSNMWVISSSMTASQEGSETFARVARLR